VRFEIDVLSVGMMIGSGVSLSLGTLYSMLGGARYIRQNRMPYLWNWKTKSRAFPRCKISRVFRHVELFQGRKSKCRQYLEHWARCNDGSGTLVSSKHRESSTEPRERAIEGRLTASCKKNRLKQTGSLSSAVIRTRARHVRLPDVSSF
jgi:hypothetical protein